MRLAKLAGIPRLLQCAAAIARSMKDAVTIKCIDLADDMQAEAVSCATKVNHPSPAPALQYKYCLTHQVLCVQAVELHAVEKEIASHIKKHFDAKYKPTWHCIVGKSFGEPPACAIRNRAMQNEVLRHWGLTPISDAGSYVTHESRHFIYFYLGALPHRHLEADELASKTLQKL